MAGRRQKGGEGPDTLVGGPFADLIYLFGGDDLAEGLGGGDTVLAGDGADTVIGGPDDDHIEGGDGDDRLGGGDGDDSLDGGGGDDRLSSDLGRDTMRGGAGHDHASGGADRDHLDGGAGDDTLSGGTGDDLLLGGAGGDALSGGAGDDLLVGGAGADRLDGGAGLDAARFAGVAGAYVFSWADGETRVAAAGAGAARGGADRVVRVERLIFADATLTPVDAVDDAAAVVAGAAVMIDALANDLAPNGRPLAIVSLSFDGGGRAAPRALGVLFDTLDAFRGLDDGESALVAIDYEATDGVFGDRARVTVRVLGVNDAPVAARDRASVSAGAGRALADVLANDVDPDGDPLFLTGAGATRGTVSIVGGRVAFDPGDAFAFLRAGERAAQVVRYRVSDGDAETTGRLVVTVAGADDAPVARDDGPVYVEAGGLVAIDLLANDVDPDGDLRTASVRVSGVEGGVVALAGGVARFRADAAGFDAADDSRVETFRYTVADARGARSAPAEVTVRIVDPLRAADLVSVAGASGQTVALGLETEARTLDDSSPVRVRIGVGPVDATPVNVSFVVDESGSVTAAEFAEAQAAVQRAIDRLRGDFAGSGAPVAVQIVAFATKAQAAVYDLFDPALDDVAAGTPIATRSGGATNLDAALAETLTFFGGAAGARNRMLVISDIGVGEDTTFVRRLGDLDALNVGRAAVRFFSGSLGVLDLVDNTGGAEVLPGAAALGDVFALGPARGAALVGFTLRQGGAIVADMDDLVEGDGGFALEAMLRGLSVAPGARTEIVAEAAFDADGDGRADVTATARTTIVATDGGDVIFL